MTSENKMIKGSAIASEVTVEDSHKFFNLQKIIATTRIQQDKLYNNMKGSYDSLTTEEKKRVATCLMIPVRDMFARLGMSVSFQPIPKTQEEANKERQAQINKDLDGSK